MTWLARLSLANRSLVALAALVAIVFGVLAIPSLKQELFPSLEFPAATVVAPYPGASPELVEQQVVRPIEGAVKGIDIQIAVDMVQLTGPNDRLVLVSGDADFVPAIQALTARGIAVDVIAFPPALARAFLSPDLLSRAAL